MTLPMSLVDFQQLSPDDQYASAQNYILDMFNDVKVDIEYVPMDILHSLVVFVQQHPNLEEKQIMYKFMTYPLHNHNFKTLHGFYKDIYASTRAYSIVSHMYINENDMDPQLFHQVSMFVENVPYAPNDVILLKIHELQHH